MSIRLDSPFLTDLDSRAAVKGSRDPLGIQPLWTRFGRHVVGNLTTVSNSVRDFTTVLLGYWLAERVSDDFGPERELPTFLMWEQLAAYARAHVNGDTSFRGTERVQRNLAESKRITLSAAATHQILGDQKIYGLWGLYTVPARASSLIAGAPSRLTPAARDYVERQCLPVLSTACGRDARRIREHLARKSTRLDLAGTDTSLVAAIAEVLQPEILATERQFYIEHLLHGGPSDSTCGRQRQLAGVLGESLSDEGFELSLARVAELAKSAQRRGREWEGLAHRLMRIRTCESVFAPASRVFGHLLGLDGTTLDAVSRRLRKAWGKGLRTVDQVAFAEVKPEIGDGDSEAADRWAGIAKALATGDWGLLVEYVLGQNASVMGRRGGAPWIERRAGRLHVRFHDEQGTLPHSNELPSLWRFPYFINSLRSVAQQLSMAS